MPVTPNTAFSQGQQLTADNANRFPWGLVADAGSYATTAFAANTNLNIFALNFTVQPGRVYYIFGRVGIQTTGGSSGPNALWVAASTLGNRTLAYRTAGVSQYYCELFSGGVYCVSTDFGVTSTAATKTLYMYWRCGSSGGLNTNPDGLIGANSLPHQLLVFDVAKA